MDNPLGLEKLSKLEKLELLDNLVNYLKEDLIAKKEQIPVSIFNEKLSSLESIIKYLKENLKLKNKDIAKLLNRSNKTIWITYRNAKQKMSGGFSDISIKITIPVSIFRDKSLSILENIVIHLKEDYGFSFKNISLLLKRNNKTIWTVYNRAKKKRLSQSKRGEE